jgi:hypothetical protein
MLPRKLAAELPEAERARWRIVRLDTVAELPGLILAADCDAGTATMKVPVSGEAKDYSFGPGGLAIIGR